VRATPVTAFAVSVLVALAGCGGDDAAPSDRRAAARDALSADTTRASPDGPTRALMRRVAFHMPHDVVLDISHLRGTMAPTSPDNPISFDDVESFELTIGTAEIAIGMDALTVLMNDWVFAYDDAPLRDFSFETDDDGRLVMSGKLD
jgi:hypothetical protein